MGQSYLSEWLAFQKPCKGQNLGHQSVLVSLSGLPAEVVEEQTGAQEKLGEARVLFEP